MFLYVFCIRPLWILFTFLLVRRSDRVPHSASYSRKLARRRLRHWSRANDLSLCSRHSTELQLDTLHYDMLLGHDFLVHNEVNWDYTTSTIHLGTHRRTTTPRFTPHIDNLAIHGDPHTRAKITEVVRNYPDVFSGRVGRTRFIEHEILLIRTCNSA